MLAVSFVCVLIRSTVIEPFFQKVKIRASENCCVRRLVHHLKKEEEKIQSTKSSLL